MAMPAENAYWQVAGDTTQVWSSARVAYVPTTDAAYQAWLAAGHTTIPVISEAELSKMLNNIGLPHLAPIPSAAAVDRERDRRIALGIAIPLKLGQVVSLGVANLEDFRNISFSAVTAQALSDKKAVPLIAPGPPPTMTFRDFYRHKVSVTYDDMIEIGARVTDAVHLINEAAHGLKDMAVIPRDYKNDSYWPTIPLPPNQP